MATRSGKFRFRKHDRIGAAAAEDDQSFLDKCFVDTGDIAVLRDCSDSRRVVVGRTGSGKSALLLQLAAEERQTIVVRPESLSLNHIANSGVIQFCSEAGINLDIFYKLLWRHVFTVELLKHRHQIVDESSKRSFMSWLFGQTDGANAKRRQAIEYLERFGSEFWKETEYRIEEITAKIEDDLKAAISAKLPSVTFEASGARKLSQEEKTSVIHRGQEIVHKLQVRQLDDVLDLLKDDLADSNESYFIIIDRLDEDWVDDAIRYQLIKALIDTSREFRRIPNVKIVPAIRTDLLERVFERTRNAGFQEEKYRAICLPVTWSRKQIREVLDRRVDQLIRDAYTQHSVTLTDLLPKTSNNTPAVDYVIDRTLLRPRDAIEFLNSCIQHAEDSARITRSMIQEAEAEYSRSRLHAVGDEWFVEYPGIVTLCRATLNGKGHSFRLGDLTDDLLAEAAVDAIVKQGPHGRLLSTGQEFADDKLSGSEFRKLFISTLYKTGIVGIKADGFEKVSWAEVGVFSISPPEITDETRITIHPAFWRALGVVPPAEKRL